MAQSRFDDLMRVSFLQRFPGGVDLAQEGEPCDFLHVVIEGLVALHGSANGRSTVIALVRPVSTFILAAANKDSVHLMSARTLAPSRILMVPSDNIRALFAHDAAFAQAVVRELATGYRGMVRGLKDQKLRTGVERLANCLLRLHQEQGEPAVIVLPVEKRTLASLLGMTPESLSRGFAALASHGVEVDGDRIALTRLRELRQVAKPHRLIDGPDC